MTNVSRAEFFDGLQREAQRRDEQREKLDKLKKKRDMLRRDARDMRTIPEIYYSSWVRSPIEWQCLHIRGYLL